MAGITSSWDAAALQRQNLNSNWRHRCCKACHNKYLSKWSNIKSLAACKLGIRFGCEQQKCTRHELYHYPRGESVHLSCSDDKRNKSKRAGWGLNQGLGALWSRRPHLQSSIHRCNRQLAPLTGSFVRKVHKCAAHNEALLSYRVAGTGHLTTGGLMSLPKSITRALLKSITRAQEHYPNKGALDA